MRHWISLAISILGLIGISIIHISAAFILPYPWSKINILFVFFIILLLWRHSGLIIWLVFFTHLFIELFAISPFGIMLFSSTIAFLLGYWLYQFFFTNRSWYAAVALSSFIIISYRIFYILIIIILNIFNIIEFIPWKMIIITSWWEFLFTNLLVGLVYFILSRFSKKLNSALIDSYYVR